MISKVIFTDLFVVVKKKKGGERGPMCTRPYVFQSQCLYLNPNSEPGRERVTQWPYYTLCGMTPSLCYVTLPLGWNLDTMGLVHSGLTPLEGTPK